MADQLEDIYTKMGKPTSGYVGLRKKHGIRRLQEKIKTKLPKKKYTGLAKEIEEEKVPRPKGKEEKSYTYEPEDVHVYGRAARYGLRITGALTIIGSIAMGIALGALSPPLAVSVIAPMTGGIELLTESYSVWEKDDEEETPAEKKVKKNPRKL